MHGHPGRVSKARIGGGGDGGRVPLAAPTEAGSAMQHPKLVKVVKGCGTWRSRGPFFFDSAGGELREAVGAGGELRARAPRFQPRLSGSMSSSSRLALAAVTSANFGEAIFGLASFWLKKRIAGGWMEKPLAAEGTPLSS